MIPHALTLLVLSAAPPLPSLDGAYLVDRSQSESFPGARVFEIREDTVEARSAAGLIQVGRVERDDKALSFIFPYATFRTTYAVLDGVLWLGVFRKEGGSEARWVSLAEGNPSIEPLLPVTGPALAVLDEGRKRWQFVDGRTQKSGERKLAGRLEVSDGFYPLVESAPEIDPFAVDAQVRQLPHAHGRPFRQAGEVILAPWSVAAGRTGLIPQRGSARALYGRWVSPQGDMLVLAASGEPRPSGYPMVVPEPHQVVPPSGQGIFLEQWGKFCAQNHMDYPSTAVFVVLSDNRLLKHTWRGTHDGRTLAGDVLYTRQK